MAEEALESLDEEDSAYRAGRKLLRRLEGGDFQTFRHQMGNYLRRRGFSYGIAVHTTQRLWEELSNPPDCDIDGHAQE